MLRNGRRRKRANAGIRRRLRKVLEAAKSAMRGYGDRGGRRRRQLLDKWIVDVYTWLLPTLKVRRRSLGLWIMVQSIVSIADWCTRRNKVQSYKVNLIRLIREQRMADKEQVSSDDTRSEMSFIYDLTSAPCFRQSTLYGIGGGAAIGAMQLIRTSTQTQRERKRAHRTHALTQPALHLTQDL